MAEHGGEVREAFPGSNYIFDHGGCSQVAKKLTVGTVVQLAEKTLFLVAVRTRGSELPCIYIAKKSPH